MKTFFTYRPPKGGHRIPDWWGPLSCCITKVVPVFLLITLFSLPGFSQMMSLKNADKPITLNVADSYIDSQKPVILEAQEYVTEGGIIYNESTYRLNIGAFADPVPAPTPCQAHRWFDGDGWRFTNGAWTPTVLSSPSLQPKGIVRCASSAETESGLETSKGTYVIANNPIAAVLPKTDCFSMTTETFGNTLSAPTQGEDIVWLNFDIRPLAGTYQFQIVTNQSVGWVLFHVDPDFAQPTGGNDADGIYPNPDAASYNGFGVSGDCSQLEFATIDIGGIAHPACGFSGNGWTTITVPSFKKPTNYYLAMWMASPAETQFPNSMNLVYKSRFGCGGATCTLEFQNKEVVCNNNGTYTVCSNYGGSAGRWFITDQTGLATNVSYTTYKQDGTTVVSSGSNPPTNPLAMELGTIPDGAVFAKVCATYPLGTAYDVKLTPDPAFKPSQDYIQCADGDEQTGPSAATATVSASANPTAIDITSAAHNTVLSVTSVSPGVIADYTYLWTKPANAAGTLTNATSSTATYTAALADAGQTLVFTVVATPKNPAVCPASTTVSVDVGTVGICAVTGPSPVCQGSTNTYTGAPTIGGTLLSFKWTVTGATIVGVDNGQTVNVLAGATNYTVIVAQTYANPELNATCSLSVTVTPSPTCSITGPEPVCGGSVGNIYTSTVLPAGGTVSHSWSITGSGSIVGSTTGASISVTAGASGTYTVTDNISRDGCTSTCSKTVTVNAVPSCSITGPDPVCGGSTGNTYTSTVLPAGGTVTHNWSITGSGSIVGSTTGASISVTAGASGTYTVTDNISRNGCTSTCSKTVTVNPAPTCSIAGPDAVCAGSPGNMYTSTVLPAGGTVTHSWSITGGSIVGATNGASIIVTAGASGTFTVTDNISRNGCTSTCSKTVTINPGPTCTIAGPDPVCGGSTGNTYTSTVSPAGGTATHSWTITGSGSIVGSTTGSSISVTAGASGTYTVTDNISRDGCTSTCSKTVTVNAVPSCSIAGPDPVCGGSTGNTYTSTVLPAGGTVTHNWSITGSGSIVGSTTGSSISVTAGASGTYTVTDNISRNGCTSTCNKTVTINPVPSCTIAGPDAVCAGSPGNMYTSTVLPAGGTVTHSWSITGGSIVGSTTGASIIVTAGASGTFTVTDNISRNGCTSTCSKTVTINPGPTCSITGPDPVCGGSVGNIYTSTVSPAGGTATHSWSITGSGSIVGSTTGASISVTAGASGTYTVTDNISRDGCTSTCSKTVTVNPIPSCTIAGPDPVCGGSTGNTYTSTVLPAGGTVTHSWSITGSGSIVGSTTGSSISVTAGASGTYTVTDNISRNGCTSTCSKTVTISPVPSCTIAGPDAVCAGSPGNMYTSTVLPAGGTVTHSWSITGGSIIGSTTGASIIVTAGASGTFTVTDNISRNGCTSTCSKTVTINPGPTCTIAGPDPVCGGSTGNTYTSTVSPAGGTATHSWSITGNGNIVGATNGASISVTAGASGTYTVTDNISRDGCTSTCSKTVTVNPIPSCTIAGPDPVCGGSTGNTYTSTVLPAGGTVTHSWTITGSGSIVGSTTGSSISVTAGASGTYTVTDNISRNGCTSTCSKTVTINAVPSCSIAGPDAVCAGSPGNMYTSTVLPAGGTVTHSWSITGGSIVGATNGASIIVTAGASGTFTVTDNISRNGCTSTCSKIVTINPGPTCTIAGPDPVCGGSTGNTYTSTVTPAGGTATHSWTITGSGTIVGATTGSSISVNAGASGTYTVTDNISREGCTSTCSKTVTINPAPSCSIAGPDAVCGGSLGNTYTSTVSPAGGTVTHSWSITGSGSIIGSTTGSSISVTAGASGTYTVTDNISRDGCTSTCSKTVTVNATPTCTIAGPDAVCGGSTGNTYTSTVSPAGGTVTHSWTISGDGTIVGATNGASVSVTAGASGTYTVTDNISRNGCTGSCSKTVTINACGKACTPGFWKNHPEVWDEQSDFLVNNMPGSLPSTPGGTFITTTSFYAYFQIAPTAAISTNANLTMIGATALGGGGCKALARHAVSALLGAAAFPGEYPFPAGSSDFLSLYNLIRNAFISGDCEALHTILADINELDGPFCGALSKLPPASVARIFSSTPVSDDLSLTAYPNPYNNVVNFRFASPKSGKAILEVYDIMGRRMAIIYQGQVSADVPISTHYNVPKLSRVALFYRLTVDGKTIHGSVLPEK